MEAKQTLRKPEAPKPTAKLRSSRSFFRNDFPIIQDATITLMLGLVLGGGAVYGSLELRNRWQQMEERRESERREAQARLDEAIVERREILTYQPLFEQMKHDGLIGEETRLDLVEGLRQTRDRKKLLSLTYTVSPQKSLAVDPSVVTGSMELRGSQLDLKMPLLHERDLLSLLGELKGNGIFAPESCRLTRRELARSEPMAARLQADCSVFLLTIGRRVAASPVPPPLIGG